MKKIKSSIRGAALTFLATILFYGGAHAQSETGRPGDPDFVPHRSTIFREACPRPDGDQPMRSLEPPRAHPATQPNRVAPEEAEVDPMPLWQVLGGMALADRANTAVQIEPLADFMGTEEEEAREIERLWNSGRFDEAVAGLRGLEEAGEGPFAVGVRWKTPKPAAGKSGGPDTPVEAQGFAVEPLLDFDPASGNLFAVIRRNGYSCSWSVSISKDQGLSWSETYSWYGDYSRDISAAVVDQYLYVVHEVASEARIRRFYLSNGSVDSSYLYQKPFSASHTTRTVALTSNVDSDDNRLYCFGISQGELIYSWSNQNGSKWIEEATGIDNLPTISFQELDACWNEGFTDAFVMVTYEDIDSNICAALRSDSGWTVITFQPHANSWLSRIAAYQDNIMVEYSAFGAATQEIMYFISYDGGGSWSYGTVASSPDENYNLSDVTGRRNGGFFVCYYGDNLSGSGKCWFRRRDYEVNNWSAPETFNQVGVFGQYRLHTEWIPPLPGGRAPAHGMVWRGNDEHAYFDRSDAAAGSLAAEAYTLPASTGAVIDLFLSAGVENANRGYLVLGSISGTSPGIPLPKGLATLPLNWDLFTDVVISLVNTQAFYNFYGKLSYGGSSVARIEAPPLSGLFVGVNLYFSYLLFKPYDFASNAICIKIVP